MTGSIHIHPSVCSRTSIPRLGKMDKLRQVFSRGKKDSSHGKTPTTPSQSFVPSNPFSSNPSPARQHDPHDAAAVEAPPPSYAEAINPNTLAVPQRTGGRSSSPTPSVASALTVESLTREDDPYAYLSTFDTVFLIDDSPSMTGSRWREVRTLLETITPICTSHDSDGIDLYFINYKTSEVDQDGKAGTGYRNITNPRRVKQIFDSLRPFGSTHTGRRLENIIKPYMGYYEALAKAAAARGEYNVDMKPLNVIVMTDGIADDWPEERIIEFAKKLDALGAPGYQVGIQFFQVGNDRRAAQSLRRLDDELAGMGIRDMVDTVTWEPGARGVLTADGILKAVLGGVVRRLDARRNSVSSARPSQEPRGRR